LDGSVSYKTEMCESTMGTVLTRYQQQLILSTNEEHEHYGGHLPTSQDFATWFVKRTELFQIFAYDFTTTASNFSIGTGLLNK
jgi:hypothetical protein